MILIMDIQNIAMNLEAVVKIYRSCPYTQLSMAGTCDSCPLNQGFVIEDPGGEGSQLHTTVCRLIETLDYTLAMIGEDTGQN